MTKVYRISHEYLNYNQFSCYQKVEIFPRDYHSTLANQTFSFRNSNLKKTVSVEQQKQQHVSQSNREIQVNLEMC